MKTIELHELHRLLDDISVKQTVRHVNMRRYSIYLGSKQHENFSDQFKLTKHWTEIRPRHIFT